MATDIQQKKKPKKKSPPGGLLKPKSSKQKCRNSPQAYKSRHNIGNRSAAEKVSSYRESEVAVMFPDDLGLWPVVKVDLGHCNAAFNFRSMKTPNCQNEGNAESNNTSATVLAGKKSPSRSSSDKKSPCRSPATTSSKSLCKSSATGSKSPCKSPASPGCAGSKSPGRTSTCVGDKILPSRSPARNVSKKIVQGSQKMAQLPDSEKVTKKTAKRKSLGENLSKIKDKCTAKTRKRADSTCKPNDISAKKKKRTQDAGEEKSSTCSKQSTKKSGKSKCVKKLVSKQKAKGTKTFEELLPRAPRIRREACLNAGAFVSLMYEKDEPLPKKAKHDSSPKCGKDGGKKVFKETQPDSNKLKGSKSVTKISKEGSIKEGQKQKMKKKVPGKKKEASKEVKNAKRKLQEEDDVPLWPPPKRMASLNATAMLHASTEVIKKAKEDHCARTDGFSIPSKKHPPSSQRMQTPPKAQTSSEQTTVPYSVKAESVGGSVTPVTSGKEEQHGQVPCVKQEGTTRSKSPPVCVKQERETARWVPGLGTDAESQCADDVNLSKCLSKESKDLVPPRSNTPIHVTVVSSSPDVQIVEVKPPPIDSSILWPNKLSKDLVQLNMKPVLNRYDQNVPASHGIGRSTVTSPEVQLIDVKRVPAQPPPCSRSMPQSAMMSVGPSGPIMHSSGPPTVHSLSNHMASNMVGQPPGSNNNMPPNMRGLPQDSLSQNMMSRSNSNNNLPQRVMGPPRGGNNSMPQNIMRPVPGGSNTMPQNMMGPPSGSNSMPQNMMGPPSGSNTMPQNMMGPSSGSNSMPQNMMGPPSGSNSMPQNMMGPPSGSNSMPQNMMGPPTGNNNMPQNMMGPSSGSNMSRNMMGPPSGNTNLPQNMIGPPSRNSNMPQNMMGPSSGNSNIAQNMMGQPRGSTNIPQNMMGQPNGNNSMAHNIMGRPGGNNMPQRMMGLPPGGSSNMQQNMIGAPAGSNNMPQNMMGPLPGGDNMPPNMMGMPPGGNNMPQNMMGPTPSGNNMSQNMMGPPPDGSSISQNMIDQPPGGSNNHSHSQAHNHNHTHMYGHTHAHAHKSSPMGNTCTYPYPHSNSILPTSQCQSYSLGGLVDDYSMLPYHQRPYGSAFTVPSYNAAQMYNEYYQSGGPVFQPEGSCLMSHQPVPYQVPQPQVKVLVHNPGVPRTDLPREQQHHASLPLQNPLNPPPPHCKSPLTRTAKLERFSDTPGGNLSRKSDRTDKSDRYDKSSKNFESDKGDDIKQEKSPRGSKNDKCEKSKTDKNSSEKNNKKTDVKKTEIQPPRNENNTKCVAESKKLEKSENSKKAERVENCRKVENKKSDKETKKSDSKKSDKTENGKKPDKMENSRKNEKVENGKTSDKKGEKAESKKNGKEESNKKCERGENGKKSEKQDKSIKDKCQEVKVGKLENKKPAKVERRRSQEGKTKAKDKPDSTFKVSSSPRARGTKGKQDCHFGWHWEGEPEVKPVFSVNDAPPIEMKCYPRIRHSDGDMINIRDCVLVRSGPRKKDIPYVAKISALWEHPDNGEMLMSVLWYYRPDQMETERIPQHLDCELFASKHRDQISVACIDDKCYVLTLGEYCRYRASQQRREEGFVQSQSVVPDTEEQSTKPNRMPPLDADPETVFLCRRVYDFKLKRALKNPT